MGMFFYIANTNLEKLSGAIIGMGVDAISADVNNKKIGIWIDGVVVGTITFTPK